MESIEVDISGKSEDEVMEEVLNEIFGNSPYFGGGTESIEPAEGTDWGEPNNWYTSPKFKHRYATIDTEDWLNIQNAIGHDTRGAYQDTVERVKQDVENGTTGDIPTPTLALEPDEYGVNPVEYVPVREGRSRGVGAYEAGLKRMPILVAVRRHRK